MKTIYEANGEQVVAIDNLRVYIAPGLQDRNGENRRVGFAVCISRSAHVSAAEEWEFLPSYQLRELRSLIDTYLEQTDD